MESLLIFLVILYLTSLVSVFLSAWSFTKNLRKMFSNIMDEEMVVKYGNNAVRSKNFLTFVIFFNYLIGIVIVILVLV